MTAEEYGDSINAANTLAAFITALRRLQSDGAPAPTRAPNEGTRRRNQAEYLSVAQEFDSTELARTWKDGLAAPPWQGSPVWYHGDFHPGNLLAGNQRITAVVDFGGLGTGDPANDLMMAFALFSPVPRSIFRQALGADDPDLASRPGVGTDHRPDRLHRICRNRPSDQEGNDQADPRCGRGMTGAGSPGAS